MREIKFRAWLPNHKKMYPVIQLSGKFPDEDFYRVFIAKEWVEGEPMNFRCGKDNPVMQYTGLKDKNGKEIYEGDICFTESKEYPRNKLVIWNEGMACFQFDYPLGKSLIQKDSIEIIGNVYENADLLAKQG